MNTGAQTMQNLRVLLYGFFAMLGAACAGSALAEGKTQLEVAQYLRVNDYLVAADRMSHAVLQPDGNLCVFRGAKPQSGSQLGSQSGPKSGQPAPLWCSGSARSKGDYYAIFGADANLCINRGKAPAEGREVSTVWCWGDKDVVGGRYVLRVEGAALCAFEMLVADGSAKPRPLRVLWASRKLNKLSGFTGSR
jgi:hypothetical protein